jgi:hypothetical protein
MGKPRGRWDDDVWSDAVDLLQIRNWKAAARKGVGGRRSERAWSESRKASEKESYWACKRHLMEFAVSR